MQLKTYQIVATLNLDCFRPVGLYSDRVLVVWIAFFALTDKQTLILRHTNSLEKRCPRTQLSMVNSIPTIRLARLAAGLVYTQAMISQKWWHHTVKFMADEILADCYQNRQSAKINSPPKFLAIRYQWGQYSCTTALQCRIGPQHYHPQSRTTSLQSSSLISKTSINVLTHIRLKRIGGIVGCGNAWKMEHRYNFSASIALHFYCSLNFCGTKLLLKMHKTAKV